MASQNLRRSMGVWQASSLVVGTVIGTGIFLKATTMTQQLGAVSWVLLAWLVAGLLSYAGALTYAELCSRLPGSGGEYLILKKSYGNGPAFLFGWMRFWIAAPGSIAAYAVGAGTFMGGAAAFFPGSSIIGGPNAAAVCFVILFSLLNCFRVKWGAGVQVVLTGLKSFLILGIGAVAFIWMVRSGETFSLAATGVSVSEGRSVWSLFGLAMVSALWAYDGWNNLSMVGDEIQEPQKNIPRALAWGMLWVVLLYLILNIAYFSVLGIAEVSSSSSSLFPSAPPVVLKLAQTVLGSVALPLVSVALVISALGAMNGSILTGARVPFAMARDGLFFKQLGEVNSAEQVPVASIVAQGLISVALALSGTFDQLTDYVVLFSWIFYILVAAAIFRWRKQAGPSGVFKMPGYPWVPSLFILLGIGLVLNSLITRPMDAWMGLLILGSGIPVYFAFSRKLRKIK